MKAKNIKTWHKEVCKNGYCEVCGHIFAPNMLCGHHKKRKGAHPELKLETDNGVCVCFFCHLKLHNGQKKL